MLTEIDYVAIALYAVILIGVGYFYARKETAEAFLISERKMSLFGAIATINATKTGSIVLLYTALLYEFGSSAMWYFIGMWIGYLAFIPFAKKLYRASNARYYTLADYFADRYGCVAGYASSIITIIVMVGFLVLNLIAAAKVLSFFSGISSSISAILIAAVILIYLSLAGFKAVVKTDIFQYIAIFFILIAFLFPLSRGTVIPVSEWNLFTVNIGDMLGFLLIGILLPFASPDLWQRVYALPTEKRVTQSILLSILLHAAVCIVLTCVGLLIKTQLPHVDPDIALIEGFAQLLPIGMSGLAIVVFFAAFMSSIDTYAYTASSSIVQDFFKQLNKEETVTMIRKVLVAVLVFGTVIALTVNDLGTAAFIFISYIITLAVPALATWLVPSIRNVTVSTGIVFGGVALTVLVAYDLITDSLQSTLVVKGIGVSVVGLLLGAILSYLQSKHYFSRFSARM